MTTSIGTVTGMPANGATGVNPNIALVPSATITDTSTGLAYLEVQLATDAAFTAVIADVRSQDVAAGTGAPESVQLQLSGATRDAGLAPFGAAGGSVWNTAIGGSATYSAGTGSDARVTDFAADAGGVNSVSFPVLYAEATDIPIPVNVGGILHGVQMPATAAPSADTVHGMVVVSPDHTISSEVTGAVVGAGGGGLITGNLLSLNNQDVETSIGSWVANTFAGDTGCTVARSNTKAYSGTWSVAVSATTTGASGICQAGAAIVVGTTYYTLIYANDLPGRHVSANVQWLDSGGGFLSNSYGADVLMTGAWVLTSASGQAPAGAVTANVYVYSFDSVSGDTYYADYAYLGTSASPATGGWTATSFAQVDLIGAVLPRQVGSGWAGVRGCGASALAGMVRVADQVTGTIGHALAIGMSTAQVTTTSVWPAATDPAQAGGGGPSSSLITGNQLSLVDQDVEGGLGSWQAQIFTGDSGCTVAQSTTQHFTGTHSIQITATTAGAGALGPTVTGVSAGTTYYGISRISLPVGKTAVLYLQWRNSSHTQISVTGSSTVTGTGVTNFLTGTSTAAAPAGTVEASYYWVCPDSVAGICGYVDHNYFGLSAAPAESGGATGHNPMGELLAIPATTNVATLGLSVAGLAAAHALQDYGGYVVGVEAGFRLYVEPGIDATFLSQLTAAVATLTANLRVVTNSATALGALATAGAQGGGTPRAVVPPIAQKPAAAPVNLTVPVVSGTLTVGGILTATAGTWTGSPALTYQWRQDQVTPILGATTSRYTLVSADAGHSIDVLVTGTTGGGTAQADSAPTGTIASGSGGGSVSFFLQPFNSIDPFNTPIQAGATFAGAGNAAVASLRANGMWINWSNGFSFPIYQAAATDPINTISTQSGTVQYRIPDGAIPALPPWGSGYTDAHMLVIDPTGQFVDECWQMQSTGTHTWTTPYHLKNDITADSWSHGGVRAWGGSAMAGIIRGWEVEAGVINHAVSCDLLTSQMNPGPRFTWPATTSDGGVPYTGLIPMGALLAIPSTTTLTGRGLTAKGLMLAVALQRFGTYVCDTAGQPVMQVEQTYTGGNSNAYVTDMRNDLVIIWKLIDMVTNNSQSSVGG